MKINVGVLCTNNNTATKLVDSVVKMYDNTSVYGINKKSKVQYKKDLSVRNDIVFVKDVKHADQVELMDVLVILPDFSDTHDFARNNKPRQYSVWNEIRGQYEYHDEDDSYIVNMNRYLYDLKKGYFVTLNHVNETIYTKLQGKPTYILFGEQTMPKIAELMSHISGVKHRGF